MTKVGRVRRHDKLAVRVPARARRAFISAAGALVLLASIATSTLGIEDPALIGEWDARVKWPAVSVHTILLHTGKVLFFRGDESIPKAYLWNPLTEAVEQTPLPGDNIFCSGHSFLPDGRVLVTGGDTGIDGLRNRTLIFDPATEQWHQGPSMPRGRYYPANVTNGDGRIFVFSGKDEEPEKDIVEYVEVYTEPNGPGSGRWDRLPPSADNKMNYYPRMILMPDGKMFHAGESPITELFDPVTKSWSFVAETNYTKRYEGTAVILPPGHQRIMIIGGGKKSGIPTDTAEIIDMSEDSPAWRYTAPMHYRRKHLNAVILPDATVMVGGGTDDGTPIYPAEIFDPETETWTVVASLASKRGYHSGGTLLPDGRVLWSGANGNPSREVYSPAYLFRGPQPVISAAPAAVDYDEIFTVQTPDAFSVESVVFMRPSMPTHAFNVEQRYVPLTFEVIDANTLQVLAPGNPNIAQPGYYLLFIVDGDGIPSKAPFVHLLPHAGVFATTTTTTTMTTTTTTTLPPLPECGDGIVNQFFEDCDGGDDAGCPDRCLSDCRCGVLMQGSIIGDVTAYADDADSNYGADTELWVDGETAKTSFFRAGLSGIGDGTIVQATLSLHTGTASNAASNSGGRIHAISACSWDEDTLTWNTRPAIDGAMLDTQGAVDSASPVDFDVTDAFTGDGPFCFAIDSLSANGATYLSREASTDGPELWITYRPADICEQGEPCDTFVPGACAIGTQDCQGPDPVCIQTVEPAADDATCDGVDDDCDGATDEDFVGASTTCGGLGACRARGQIECRDGAEVDTCTPGEPAASDTTCDDEDDDCDGLVDDDYVNSPTICGVGACAVPGEIACLAGIQEQTCTAGDPLAADDVTCDGVDDDCNGVADEDYVATPTSCGVGACTAVGLLECQNGALVDTCAPAASDTTCDGVDDDCDGAVDEDYVVTPTTCGVGPCSAAGELRCENGTPVDTCTEGAPLAADDTSCDGLDDDCDGTADEDYVLAPTSCGVGACRAAGLLACQNGAEVDTCTPGQGAAADTTCDGVDDDCDGAVDEDYVAAPTTCGVGACTAAGELQCQAGSEVDTCAEDIPLAADDASCDGVDDDCDGTADEDACGAGEVCNPSTGQCDAAVIVASIVADATVMEKESNTNFNEDELLADASAAKHSFLRINVSGLGGRQVGEALLHLTVASGKNAGSEHGGEIRLTSCDWGENTITWDGQPAIDTEVIDEHPGAVTNGETVTFDLTGSITNDGDHCFAITSPTSDGVNYLSRETAAGPLVEIAAAGTQGTTTTTTSSTTTTISPGPTTTTTLPPPGCGDGIVNQATEECDGSADAACPGLCLSDCRCAASLQGTIEADVTAYAEDANANYGADTELWVDAKTVKTTYLRGRVNGVGTGTIVQALLRLHTGPASNAASDFGGRLHGISGCTWDEDALTWNTRPAIDGTLLATQGAVEDNAIVDFDVTAALVGDGPYCFALDSLSSNGATYLSREASSGAPELWITYRPGAGGPPTTTTTGPDPSTTSTTTSTTSTTTSTTLPSVCGDGVHDPQAEECDGADDAACPGACGIDCNCATLTLVVPVDADVAVREKEADENFGASPTLSVDADTPKRTYLRVQVDGIENRQILNARLHLQVLDEKSAKSDSGGQVFTTSDCGWDELAMTWDTRAGVDGALLDTLGPVDRDERVTFDITTGIVGDGTYCLVIDSQSSDSVKYLSREAGIGGPVVELTLSTAQP